VSDPFSQPPLMGSKSDEVWVKQNASLFTPGDPWAILKLLIAVVLLVVFVFPIVAVLFGMWAAGVFVLVLEAALVLRLTRKRRRRSHPFVDVS
jgi:Flp pilus assembly protein TadB